MSSWAEDRVRIIKLEDFRSNQADYIDSINNYFGISEEPEVKQWFTKVGFHSDLAQKLSIQYTVYCKGRLNPE